MKRLPIPQAILAGVLGTAPLIAIFSFGWRWFGFPFLPFDLFDKLSRLLPGSLITYSIETTVSVISALHVGSTDTAAKTAEQAIAISIFFIALVTTAAVYCASPGTRLSRYVSGSAVGFLMALLLAVIATQGNTAQIDPIFSFLWIFVLMLFWGLAIDWLRGSIGSATASNQPAQVGALNRRQLLVRLGEASALITVAGAVVSALPRGGPQVKAAEPSKTARWSDTHPLPNADAAVKPAPGTRPEFTRLEDHYRIDINTEPPVINEESWTLRITGLVEHPINLKLSDLTKFEPMHQFVTLSCISNLIAGDLIGTTRWTGVSMQHILQLIRPLSKATHLKITSADDFYEVVALDAIRKDARLMLTYAWDGVPLTTKHGFPLRIYIPDRYGMKQPKWIQAIEVIDHPEDGYWVERGWDAVARMRATSVLDTMSSNMMIAERKGNLTIPLGGIAHAGARGISRVQVKVDDQPWQDAQLRTPLSETTWVIWRFDWSFKPGRHIFTVRCLEADGTPQETIEAPPHPRGATGLHSIKAVL